MSRTRSSERRDRARRRLRALRRVFWKSLAVIIIVSAALVSLGRLLAPYADVSRPLVERLLSDALDQPVRIRELRARWPRMSPEIRLIGLEIGSAEAPLLQLDQARLQLRLYNLARPARNTLGLAALGLDVAVIQAADGRWSWQLEQGRIERGWERILTAGDLTLREVGIRVEPRALPALALDVPEAALARDGNRLALELLARPDGAVGDPIRVALRLDLDDGRLTGLNGHARVPELQIDADPEAGTGLVLAGEGWIDWTARDGLDGLVDLDLVRRVDDEAVERARLESALRGQGTRFEIGFELADPGTGEAWVARAALGTDRAHYAMAAEFVDLARLHAWVAPWRGRGLDVPSALGGTLHDFAFGAGAEGRPHAARGRIRALRAGFEAQSLDLELDELDFGLAGDALRLQPSGALALDWPTLFPEPVRFDRSDGALGWRPGRIEFDGLEIADAERVLRVDGGVLTDPSWTSGVMLDLLVDTPRLAAERPQRWLPLKGLPADVRRWLARALIAVERVEARTTLFGDPTTWKRSMAEGALNSRIRFEGLTLDYARGWPRGEDLHGRLEFLGPSMDGAVEAGRVAGVALRAPTVRIAHLPSAEIELDLASAPGAGAADLARLTRALPLAGAREALDAGRWSGPASAEAAVWLPMRGLRDWRLAGAVRFNGAALDWNTPRYRLDAIRGAIGFQRAGFGPARLEVERDGTPLSLDVRADFAPRFALHLAGRWPLDRALPDDAFGLDPQTLTGWLDRVSGTVPLAVEVLGGGAGSQGSGNLRVASDLVGLSLDLPAPMNKAAGAAWPFELVVPLGRADAPVRLDLVDRAEVLWSGSERIGVGLGSGAAELPASGRFDVDGELPVLDLGGWLGLAAPLLERGAAGAAAAARVDGRVALRIEDARLGRTSLGAMTLDLGREDDYWRLGVDGPAVAGRVRLPGGGSGIPAIVAEFQRVHWPRGPAVDEPPGRPSTLDPRRLPEIDLRIDDLRFGELELGRLTMNSHAAPDGLEIEQFATESEALALTGSGNWRSGEDGRPTAGGRFRFTADGLGRVLNEAGFDLALQRGQAVITLDGRWPGSPLDFTLQRFDGALDLVIGDGVIPEAQPGAGRLLGLVSLNSIPRRLRLDFTDVFAEGLTFDRVAGHFELADGEAVTDDLVIEAPAAIVRVRGRTDLVDRTYDQTLIVQPGVGSTLPIIGALTGGPIGAAAGAALQQLLDKPLRGISEVQYAVTGPWSDPSIVPISARGVEALPGEESPPDEGGGG
ncbi:TIGR02099 family protein [Wenzhouxiangella sp. XN79A]|uniref:YhdP family protein n=1 Tax=Wenzhouxiangella sp. XN79A TaxID=2724193 RepID=UPI00144A6D0E|nr:YhdP family protein [Wenzhouxiangella sp. XN79A]NKI35744.1 TIGR02099 family protein [Wenzhouxiangella sp. XN79A]